MTALDYVRELTEALTEIIDGEWGTADRVPIIIEARAYLAQFEEVPCASGDTTKN